jgi:hypothetical protein
MGQISSIDLKFLPFLWGDCECIAGMLSQDIPPNSIRTSASIPTLVYAALVRLLGRERAEIVDFFVDSRLAAADPDGYERAVRSLLGDSAGSLIITALTSELARSVRATHAGKESLLGEVRTIEKTLGVLPRLHADA